jgi:hypothetical protein
MRVRSLFLAKVTPVDFEAAGQTTQLGGHLGKGRGGGLSLDGGLLRVLRRLGDVRNLAGDG